MTRRGKRQIGRKIDWCIVGLQNHQQMAYWVHPVCLGILEVVILIAIWLPMVRTIVYESETNEGNLKMQLDWADEEREAATVQLTSYQQRTMA